MRLLGPAKLLPQVVLGIVAGHRPHLEVDGHAARNRRHRRRFDDRFERSITHQHDLQGARQPVGSRALEIGQAAQRPQGAGIQSMRVLDDEQRRLVICGLLQREHTQHRQHFIVGTEIGIVAKLLQRGLEQSRGIEAAAVDHRAFLVIVARNDEMLDKRGFAG